MIICRVSSPSVDSGPVALMSQQFKLMPSESSIFKLMPSESSIVFHEIDKLKVHVKYRSIQVQFPTKNHRADPSSRC